MPETVIARAIVDEAAADELPAIVGRTLAYDILVWYSGANGWDMQTVDGDNLEITGPGFSQASPASISVVSSQQTNTEFGATLAVTYRVTGPGGLWDHADNGTYTINLGTKVTGEFGGQAVDPSPPLATFAVSVPNDAFAGRLWLTAQSELVGLGDVGNSHWRIPYTRLYKMATGVQASQADRHWAGTLTVPANGSVDLDLIGGLTSPDGGALNISKLKLLIARLKTTTAGAKVTGAFLSDDAESIAAPLRPGGLFVIFSPDEGYPVTDAVTDLVTFADASGDGPHELDVVVWGCAVG